MRRSTSSRVDVTFRRSAGRGFVGLLGAVLACGDDAATTERVTQDATGSATAGSDTGVDGRALRVTSPLELCIASPTRFTSTFTSSPLFHFRGVLRLAAATIPLPAEPGVQADAWLPFTLTTAQGAEVGGAEGEGAVSVAADSVPSAIYALEEEKGWETVVYTDDPEAPTAAGSRLLVQVAYPAGTSDFAVAPVAALDRELRLRVTAFVPGVAADDPPMRARAVPCTLAEAQVDRVDVTLAEGTMSFHTRPALWGRFDGFTVLAEGELAGVAIEVDDYWDLEYATGDMGQHAYGFLPLMAVRFPAQPDGACILVVDPDPLALDDSFRARVLDCAQGHLRDLTVESVDVALGGGERRW